MTAVAPESQELQRLSELDFSARGLTTRARSLQGSELDAVIAQLDAIASEAARIVYGTGKQFLQHLPNRLELLIKYCDYYAQGDRAALIQALKNGTFGN
jgi:hypothetical protein